MHAHLVLHIRIRLYGYRAEEITYGNRRAGQYILDFGRIHLAHHSERDDQEAQGAREYIHHHANDWDNPVVCHDGSFLGQK